MYLCKTAYDEWSMKRGIVIGSGTYRSPASRVDLDWTVEEYTRSEDDAQLTIPNVEYAECESPLIVVCDTLHRRHGDSH